ncbi:hypothetical protein AAG570_004677 [Ranatra chinensis]|uniref:Uncharacterized protein n=1 Tax=Ranatra chinensis TaxID=642074 RepID=A0ABD0Y1M7_9HEMI
MSDFLFQLRAEKAKILKWKDKLEKEKNEAYRQLKLQTDLSEASRRRFECDRNDAYRQMTAIVAEKDALERENTRLKEALKDIEKKSRVGRSAARGASRNVVGLEKELCDLKLVAKQSATLNSQLKKGMKHLASCRRRKCSVCAYTRSTFGEYTSARSGANLFSCFQGPFVEMKKKRSRAESSASTSRMTSSSSASGGSPPPSSPLPLAHLSYIDEASTSSSSSVYAATDASTTSSSAAHAFSSDSGFSSELCCEGVPTPNKSGSGGRLRRGSNWTSSFRKLIRRVSKRPSNNT